MMRPREAMLWSAILVVAARALSLGRPGESSAFLADAPGPAAEPEGKAGVDGDVLIGVVHELAHEVEKSLERTVYELEHVDEFPLKIGRSFETAQHTFLPHFRFRPSTFVNAGCTVLLGFVWLSVYFSCLYQSDRQEGLHRWKGKLADASDDVCDSTGSSVLKPDFVVVFHHPGFDYGDDANEVHVASLDRVLVNKRDGNFESLTALQRVAREQWQPMFSTSMNMWDANAPTMRQARIALLCDCISMFHAWGLDVTTFTSIDDDEIFLCITLKQKHSIQYYLTRDRIKLPVRPEVMARLNIDMDPMDPTCAPPYLMFDPRAIEQLFKAGVLDSADENALFKDVNCIECIRIIFNQIVGNLDIGAAKAEGLLVEWFPVHNPARVAELSATWACWSALMDLSFVQPVPLLKDYFGPRIAFAFAWNGLYCKGLFALLPIAMFEVMKGLFTFMGAESRQVIGFSTVVVIWARILFNMWVRDQSFYLESWDMHSHDVDRIVRPQFKGTLEKSTIDGNIKEIHASKRSLYCRRIITALVTFLFCAFVASCMFAWRNLFDGDHKLVPSVMLSFLIKVFQFIFNNVVVWLNNYENHKHQHDYHNSLLWKAFLFHSVNDYSAFFFLTVKNAWANDGAGLQRLRLQASFTLVLLCMCSVAGFFMKSMLVKLMLWYEMWRFRRQHKDSTDQAQPEKHAVPQRYLIEEQAKYATIEDREEVEVMTTLTMSLGYVLLFGGVAPLVVPFCFFVYTVQLRAFAVLLVGSAKRTFPQKAKGIGTWQSVVAFLMNIGVVYSGFLFVAYGEAFRGSDLLAKVTGFLVYCFAMYAAWALIDAVFPPSEADVPLLAKRRDHVSKAIMSKVDTTNNLELKLSRCRTFMSGDTAHMDFIMNQQWEEIPHLDELLRRSNSLTAHKA